MTYSRELLASRVRDLDGTVVSHSAELLRGNLVHFLGSLPLDSVAAGRSEGPLIRPFGPPSPQGEKGLAAPLVLITSPAPCPLSPWGRGREAMTYGRELLASRGRDLDGAVVSHSAEPVRGNLLHFLGSLPLKSVAVGRSSDGVPLLCTPARAATPPATAALSPAPAPPA